MDARIRKIFRDVLDDRKLDVTDGLNAGTTPAWDSFAQVKLIMAFEQEFKLVFTMDEVGDLNRAGDFVRALSARGISLEP